MEYIKYVLSVRGMRCGECEAHLQDVIRKNFDVKKVKANRHKKEIVIYAKAPFDETLLKDVLGHRMGILGCLTAETKMSLGC